MNGMKRFLLCAALLILALVLAAQTTQWQWAVSAGGTGDDRGRAIAIDSQGNQYVTGWFGGTATFGSHTLTARGGWDIFAAKLDPSGNWLWAVQAGGISSDMAKGIAVDGEGNAYVTGDFMGTATFGSHTLTSDYVDIFAARLDPSGNWLWAVQAGGTSEEDVGFGIAVDGGGSAYVTGYFEGAATFGSYTLTGGYIDIFVAKIGSWTPVDEDLIPETASFSRLYDAYPNPLRPGQTATITSKVAERETGILTVLNLRGQIVCRHTLSPGSQQISLPSENLPSGVYLYQLQTPSCSEVKKLVLMK